MKKLHFAIRIDAPRERVWETMLSKSTYEVWTTPFCEGSTYEGSWGEGDRIRFLAPGGEGMVSVIAESRPNEFVSIRHVGVLKAGVEDTESDAVTLWAGAVENYAFVLVNGRTEVRVEQDMLDEHAKYMTDKWPAALAKLKELCEA